MWVLWALAILAIIVIWAFGLSVRALNVFSLLTAVFLWCLYQIGLSAPR